MYADGLSYKDMIDNLKDYRTKTGSKFGKNSFSTLLRNERYIGVYIWNKEILRVFRKWAGRKANPDIVRIEGIIPAIIDIETWERVQKRMKDNKHTAANKAKRNYLLSGLIECAECGTKYIGHISTNTKGYENRYYVCGRKYRSHDCKAKNINADLIETFVVSHLKEYLSEVKLMM